ncbi:hypothetical protein [Mycoplasmopsis cynos]|uniref:hypothetical protein n=1 Tax=Mycoplasmopsis cynos TaxID=171284 RepID=UPI002209538E|nr:hypothetical protein [Mycoplasmopsis cynos]UWV81671.1 hypothetical protein NW065_00645 [Mycoplasmopsis cynos]
MAFNSLYVPAASSFVFSSVFLVSSFIESIVVWIFSLYLFNSSIADVLAEFNSSIVAFSLSIIAFNSVYFSWPWSFSTSAKASCLAVAKFSIIEPLASENFY